MQSLFHSATGRPRAEWRTWLEQEVRDDTALVDRVMNMLSADADEASVLDRGSGERCGPAV